MCIVLGEELWSWYVDMLHHRPGRIGTQQLVDQAVVIATDLQDDWSIRVAQGQAEGASFLKLPVLSHEWAGRWRKAYGVTFRTVNLRPSVCIGSGFSGAMFSGCVYCMNICMVGMV